MRSSLQLTVLALLVGTLCDPAALSAQQRPALVAGLRPSVALVDNQHDATLESMGFRVSAYVGRPFAADFAGLLELGVTTANHRAYNAPCTFPGCSGPSSLGGETAISLAPGFQWFTTAGTRRAAFTITAGAESYLIESFTTQRGLILPARRMRAGQSSSHISDPSSERADHSPPRS